MILTYTEPNIFRMLFSIKNQRIMLAVLMFHGEDGLFGPAKVQEAYNIIMFWLLMEISFEFVVGSGNQGMCRLEPE